MKRTRYLVDARALARANETASDTDGSAVKMVTSNWYKNKTMVKRDESPMPPGLGNLTHNMEGENGLPVDPEARRERREQDEKANEQRQVKAGDQGAEGLGGGSILDAAVNKGHDSVTTALGGRRRLGLAPV